jgi:hypothetical protein
MDGDERAPVVARRESPGHAAIANTDKTLSTASQSACPSEQHLPLSAPLGPGALISSIGRRNV